MKYSFSLVRTRCQDCLFNVYGIDSGKHLTIQSFGSPPSSSSSIGQRENERKGGNARAFVKPTARIRNNRVQELIRVCQEEQRLLWTRREKESALEILPHCLCSRCEHDTL